MVRRRIIERPMSRLAVWSLRVAAFALAVTLLVVLVVRGDFLDVIPGLVALTGALFFALLAILLAFAAFVIIWNEGTGGLRYALAALLIGMLLLAYPAYIGVRGYKLPELSDVTTDTADPPRFEVIARLRPRDANPVAYPGARAAAAQRTAYPDVEPMLVTGTPQELYNAAMQVLTKRKWRVVDARSPLAGRREGHIEAIARSPVMGFRDDLVLRIRPAPGGARLDVRSASRYGRRDFGANANRVVGLIEDIDTALANQPAAKR